MSAKKNLPTIAFIPARAGSKGVASKNTKLLAGTPLYRYAVDQALGASIAHVYISTDIPDIINADLPDNVTVVPRDPVLAADDTPMNAVLQDFLNSIFTEAANIVILQPTSPLRTAEQIEKAISLYKTEPCDMVMAMKEASSSLLKSGTIEGGSFRAMRDNSNCFQNRQSLPKVFSPNGAIFVFDADTFRKTGHFKSEKICPFIMDNDTSVDIDNAEDFKTCENILAQRT